MLRMLCRGAAFMQTSATPQRRGDVVSLKQAVISTLFDGSTFRTTKHLLLNQIDV